MADDEQQRTSAKDLTVQFADQGTSNMFNQPFCCECRHHRQEAGEDICQRPVHYGTKTIYPHCSTARDEVWFGKDACGQEGKFWEPTE
jgi:hypothetical protein